MIPVWPSDLPQHVAIPSYQTGPAGRRLLTETETGPGKQRRRGARIRPLTCAIYVDRNQRLRFYRFYEEDLRGGTRPFMMREPAVDGGRLSDLGRRLTDETGRRLLIESWLLVQFAKTDPVETALTGIEFYIQLDLLVLP